MYHSKAEYSTPDSRTVAEHPRAQYGNRGAERSRKRSIDYAQLESPHKLLSCLLCDRFVGVFYIIWCFSNRKQALCYHTMSYHVVYACYVSLFCLYWTAAQAVFIPCVITDSKQNILVRCLGPQRKAASWTHCNPT